MRYWEANALFGYIFCGGIVTKKTDDADLVSEYIMCSVIEKITSYTYTSNS